MRARWTGGLAMLAAAWAVPVSAALAGKPSPPPPPPVPGGVIYFDRQAANAPHEVWSMNSDGSGKSALPAAVSGDSWYAHVPSRALHGGHRWLLAASEIAGETYSGSTSVRRELFAVRDDGAVVTQLTFQTDLMYWGAPARWSPDDATISWTASRWVGGDFGPTQIYTAAVLFDASGDVTGLASQPAAPAAALTDAFAHDWSPDGARLVVETGVGSALWIVELGSGTATPLSTSRNSSAGAYPAWSPDGSRIAFAGNDAFSNWGTISTVAPDGSGLQTLVARPRSKGVTDATIHFTFPEWSPNGSHLIYRWRRDFGRTDVHRVAATGGSSTNLTSDLDTNADAGGTRTQPLGWR